ncbi:ATP/GTP-binding protein [Acrocarpospora corrugata]|uniref:ATP/GTP-binding protein n=1 Tax=Acrocarpospora corrugata TaxID=35763 RepID=A0A5M3VS44_9ACTN|nr:tetratricopeptide repeat protein [Acrocarpospora corrugata]GER99333.1 ATP/GTP-binding protein [Acrocarpospora corrugata]
MTEVPVPDSITTQQQFAAGLSLLSGRAGLTTRGLAKLTRIPHTSIAGYLGGKNLPRIGSGVLRKILLACGVAPEEEIERWEAALLRLWWARKRPPEPPASTAQAPETESHTVASRIVVSTRPPVERLAEEPTLHGRHDLLDLLGRGLDQQATGRDTPRVHVLHGLGGSGKSTLALALVKKARARGVRTWWLLADNPVSVAEGMRALTADLGASSQLLRFGSQPDVVWRLLREYRQPWLLVIDDADNPRRDLCPGDAPVTDATGWLRPVEGRFGLVVVTSRDGAPEVWGRHASWLRLHRVDPLSAADGAKVLLDLAGPMAGSVGDARALAERLGGLPLALRLAGMHLAEAHRLPRSIAGPVSFAEFARALEEGRHSEVLGESARSPVGRQARGQVGRTWELSLDLLETLGLRYARPLLRALSCLRPAPVPYGLLLQPAVLARSALFPGLTPVLLRETVLALANVGLVDLVRDDQADPDVADLLVIHPLVRDTSRDRVEDQADAYLALLTELLSEVADGLDPKNPRSWAKWRVLADHCRAPLDLIGALGLGRTPPPGVLGPATLAARYLLSAGRLEQAEEIYETVIATGRDVLSVDHPRLLMLRHDFNRVRHMLGRYLEAEQGFRSILPARRRVLGTRHPDTLTTQHYLARVLRDLDRLDEAEDLLRRTLQARAESLGPDHSDTLTSKNNLADLLRSRGDADEAERMLTEVLHARTRLLGAEFPATLITRHYLALVACDRGDLVGAEAVLTELALICARVLGVRHPRALTVRQSLGELRHLGGDVAGAVEIMSEVLAIRSEVLGDEHPHTRATLERLRAVQR